MESANSHHHLQDQLVGSSASSLPNYGVGFTTTHAWPPSSFLNFNCLSSSSSERKQQENPSVCSHSMGPAAAAAPEMGLNNWGSEQDDCRIKEELAEHYYRKYSEILSSSASGDQQGSDLQPNDVATKFLLKSLSSYGKINNAPDFYSNTNTNINTRQIFPEYSSFNIPAAAPPGSLDMNLEALDLLVSSRFTGNFLASSHSQIGILRDDFSNYGLDQMHQSHQIPFYGSNKVSSAASSNAVTEAKRKSNKMEPKSQIQKAPKKSRLEARSSCPPFKVRKEKLGDRIAALQQLVAPFGKTDTASVLMEAIGYIKFLQTQVETLSVPYMKASRNKTNRVTKGGPVENENEEAKGDLKSRGLCLVPLSCLSYITDGGGAAVWPSPHFGGAT